jgi:gliding motility-associated-like protein
VAGPGKGTQDAPFYTFDYVDFIEADTPLVATDAYWADKFPSTLELEYDAAMGAFRISNMAEGENLVTWKVENGICRDDPRFETEVRYFVSGLVVPQAFSPNSDDINDTFIIKGLLTEPGASSIALKIMNSAGALIYSTTNEGAEWKDWDGKNNKGEDVPEGTYYYLLEIRSNREGGVDPKPKSGFVIVKRSYFE